MARECARFGQTHQASVKPTPSTAEGPRLLWKRRRSLIIWVEGVFRKTRYCSDR